MMGIVPAQHVVFVEGIDGAVVMHPYNVFLSNFSDGFICFACYILLFSFCDFHFRTAGRAIWYASSSRRLLGAFSRRRGVRTLLPQKFAVGNTSQLCSFPLENMESCRYTLFTWVAFFTEFLSALRAVRE